MRRDPAIDTLRGVAVILMVAGHVIGGEAAGGMQVSDDSGWRFSYEALEDVRMPLFAALSGFVYGHRPVPDAARARWLMAGKVRRLLVPLLTVGCMFFVVQATAPGVNQRPELGRLPWLLLFEPWHLWFLQAIFLIFVVVACLDAAGVLQRPAGWAAVTAVSAVGFVLVEIPENVAVFSVNGALRLLPLFLLGYGAKVHSTRLPGPLVAGVLLVPVYGLRLWTIITGPALPAAVDRTLSLTVATLAVTVLLATRERLQFRPLAWLGGFSFGIYLLHMFGAAGMRIAATFLGVEDDAVLFLLGLMAGVTAPVVFEVLFGRWAVVSWGVLGQKPRRVDTGDVPARTSLTRVL